MQYKIVFDCKSWTPIWIMTAFLQCFWNSTQIGFASFGNLMSSFGEVSDPFCTVFLGASFIHFSKNSKFGTRFTGFSDSRPRKIGVWGPGTFLRVFYVQKFIVLFTTLTIFYKFSPMLHKSFSYEPSRQYGTSPFLKTVIKNRNNCKRGIGKIRIFF